MINMHFHSRYTQTLTATVIALLLLMLVRLFLLLSYPADFSDLSTTELMLSLFMGLRVDIITLFTFLGLFILMLTLPVSWVHHQRYRKVIGRLWTVILIAILAISIGDVLYYYFIHRHISNELFNLSNDMNIITDMALNSYLSYTIGTALLFMGVFWLFAKLFSAPIRNQDVSRKSWIAILAIILILVLGIRNKISGKSFGVSDAFAVNKVSSGNLALSGFFTVYRTGGKKSNIHNLLPEDEAISITKALLATPSAPYIDERYPLMRQYTSKQKTEHNIVIVYLESWGAEHIDGFTHYNELNITPYFKKLSGESLKFTNFYANGYRSIFGITSLYTGITLPSGFQYLGKGLELSNLSYLGTIAQEHGYSTLAMQGSNRRSYRVDSISHIAGFEHYYGAEDIPNVEEIEAGRAPKTGTYDHNLFQFFHQQINTLKEPFLSFAFTSTNHSDFHVPHSKFERYPHDLRNYNGALNAYIYVDNAIERFIEGVKHEPWFDNTIFIFTADHGSSDAAHGTSKQLRQVKKALPSIEHFRIPLLLYAPKIFTPKEITTLGSQTDIMPTIFDILGFDTPFTALGNSLFDSKVANRFVYFYAGNLIGYITNNGYIKYNFKNIVEYSGTSDAVEQMKHELFALDTAEAALLEQNRWYK